jgi:hypothetical protein
VRNNESLIVDEKMVNLRQYLASRRVPPELAWRVQNFFHHYWFNKTLLHNTDKASNGRTPLHDFRVATRASGSPPVGRAEANCCGRCSTTCLIRCDARLCGSCLRT